MKKYLIIFIFIFTGLISYSQVEKLNLTVGISTYSLRSAQDDIGLSLGFNLKHFHWDISENIFQKKEDGKTIIGVTNVGYNIFHKNKVITPFIGYYWINKYQLINQNMYMGKPNLHLNAGIMGSVYRKRVGVGIGFGTFEFFKFHIIINLDDK